MVKAKAKAKLGKKKEAPKGDEPEKPEEEEAAEETEVPARPEPRRRTKANRLFEAQEKADKAEEGDELPEPRGVVYIGHIPAGFFEPQMKKYFSQFGTITRIRLSRSKKTAVSKGYGWIEFESESVAKIVAETMNKYLMFDKNLQVAFVPQEKVNPHLWRGCNGKMHDYSKRRMLNERRKLDDRPMVEVDGLLVPQTSIQEVEKRKWRDQKLQKRLKKWEIKWDPKVLEGDDDDVIGVEDAKPKAPKAAEESAPKAAEESAPESKKAPKKGKKRALATEAPEEVETEPKKKKKGSKAP